MFRDVVSKVAWVGRTASMVFGLALVMALMFGIATMALGADGDFFKVGRANLASAITKLTADVNGPALQVQNNNTRTNDTALDLRVEEGEAPMRVNTSSVVTNLNADKLDGLDSSRLGTQMWAVINADGTIRRGHDVDSGQTRNVGTGQYAVGFFYDVTNCAYVATTTGNFATQTGVVEGSTVSRVTVYTVDSAGNRVDLPFHLVVAC